METNEKERGSVRYYLSAKNLDVANELKALIELA